MWALCSRAGLKRRRALPLTCLHSVQETPSEVMTSSLHFHTSFPSSSVNNLNQNPKLEPEVALYFNGLVVGSASI